MDYIMNKICTDILQSDKLIELGIDVNTADMYYHNRTDIPDNYPLPIVLKHNNPLLSQETPCWSLTALMNLLDDTAGLAKEYGLWFCYDNGKSHCTKHYETQIDAVFEMVCWLKEKGKI